MSRKHATTRRSFLKAGAASAAFTIVPRRVLGGEGYVPPSETFGGALIGVGGRGPGTYQQMCEGLNVEMPHNAMSGGWIAPTTRRPTPTFVASWTGRTSIWLPSRRRLTGMH